MQFYADDGHLCEVVADHLGRALRVGEPAIVLAGEQHRRGIEARLREAGFDVDHLRTAGQLEVQDADEILAQLLVDDRIDPLAFDRVIGERVRALARRARSHVVGYGELVDEMCARGRPDAAHALEELWTALGEQQPIQLLCGYAMDHFGDPERRADFERVCHAHGEVRPLPLPGPVAQELARLQQRAAELEAEIVRRGALEQQLREALEQRRAAEAELADFVENAAQGLHRIGADGRIQWANQAELDLLGYTREEYVGRHIAEFHADPDVIADMLARLHRGETLRNYEARLRRKDGSIRHVIVDANAVFRDGQLVHTRGFTRDVTERRRTEEALRASELELRTIADALPMLVALADPAGTFRFANAAWERWFAFDPSSLIGRPLREGLPEIWDELVPHVEGVLAGRATACETRIEYTGGERRIEVNLVPLQANGDGTPAGFVLLATDTTERVELLERERSANRAKDEFLAMLGHELRNPLSPILTALQIMDGTLGDRAARERAIVERQVTHLVRLVDDLLDISRITRGRVTLDRRPVEVAPIVTKAIEMASPLLEQRRHHLDLVLAANVWVEGDADRLAQVVSNLLTNAAKYTDEGGRIRVIARDLEGEVEIAVTDSGIGIAPELLPHVFDTFVQGARTIERSQGGLGLGLAIVKSLVTMHGGAVEAYSEGVGRGSTFVVRLPRLREPAIEAPPVDPAVEAGARRILVVDDNVDAAEILAEALALSGHATRVAFDGPSALRVAEAFRPELALLDIGLPVMDGYEVAARLRTMPGLEAIKLVALTGYGQPSDAKRSLEAGLDEHLVKPVLIEDIERVVARLLPASAVRGG